MKVFTMQSHKLFYEIVIEYLRKYHAAVPFVAAS